MSHWRKGYPPARELHRAARRPVYRQQRIISGAITALAIFGWVALVLVWMAIVMAFMVPARAHHSEQHNWMLTWIAHHCCVTNDCCFEIQERDVVDLGSNRLRIVASGQVVERKGFSPDGKFYRCACENVAGRWTVFPAANTRCLFTPMQGS